jgi:hypothetical protein
MNKHTILRIEEEEENSHIDPCTSSTKNSKLPMLFSVDALKLL